MPQNQIHADVNKFQTMTRTRMIAPLIKLKIVWTSVRMKFNIKGTEQHMFIQKGIIEHILHIHPLISHPPLIQPSPVTDPN